MLGPCRGSLSAWLMAAAAPDGDDLALPFPSADVFRFGLIIGTTRPEEKGPPLLRSGKTRHLSPRDPVLTDESPGSVTAVTLPLVLDLQKFMAGGPPDPDPVIASLLLDLFRKCLGRR